jgi:hypothetical protein
MSVKPSKAMEFIIIYSGGARDCLEKEGYLLLSVYY